MLSINRFVRIFSNGLMVGLFARYGLRMVMIVAVVLAILSTFGYAIASGIISWLVFRILWGISFSAMRIGTIGYALQQQKHGFALGASRSIQEVGPMLALLFAPLFLKNFTSQNIFILLALCSLPALFFAWHLPRGADQTSQSQTQSLLGIPSMINVLTLITSVAIDGIMVVVLGILFLTYRKDISLETATALAAFYLGYRRLCLVILSATGGWLSDRVGLDRIFNVTIVFVALGLVILVLGYVAIGAFVVFTFYSMNAAITPGMVAKSAQHSLAAVAANATWRDIGAAIGTLAGGLLLLSNHLTIVLFMMTVVLVILLFIHLLKSESSLKFLYLWK